MLRTKCWRECSGRAGKGGMKAILWGLATGTWTFWQVTEQAQSCDG